MCNLNLLANSLDSLEHPVKLGSGQMLLKKLPKIASYVQRSTCSSSPPPALFFKASIVGFLEACSVEWTNKCIGFWPQTWCREPLRLPVFPLRCLELIKRHLIRAETNTCCTLTRMSRNVWLPSYVAPTSRQDWQGSFHLLCPALSPAFFRSQMWVCVCVCVWVCACGGCGCLAEWFMERECAGPWRAWEMCFWPTPCAVSWCLSCAHPRGTLLLCVCMHVKYPRHCQAQWEPPACSLPV